MQTKNNIRFQKKTEFYVIIAISVALNFFISFLYGFITPLDITLNNQEEFRISFHEVLNFMIQPMLIIFGTLTIISFLIMIFNKKLLLVFHTLLVSLAVASYLQELLMNGKMVIGENGTAVGAVTELEKGINLFIYICIMIIPTAIICYLLTKDRDNSNDYRRIGYRVVIIAALFISVMKLSGFVSSYISYRPAYQERKSFEDESYLASYEPTVSFSKENNIYVFIVDRFDSFWCDNFLESYPDFKTELDGFTFYQNNISHYINTFPSIVSFLTYSIYDNTDKMSFWEKSWSKNNALSVLKENNYNVNLILDSSSTYGTTSNILSIADNIHKLDDENIFINRNMLRRILYGLMFSRLVPYDLKEIFDFAVGDLSNGKYIEIIGDDLSPEIISCDSDCKLYDYVKHASFDSGSEKKNITIIHLNGAHDPNETLVEKTGVSQSDDVIISTIRANFETIMYYINESKDLGVYDNTTFIILGDHGCSPGEKRNGHMTMVRPNVNGLLIKPAGVEHGILKYDDSSEMSNDMFSASILEYAGLDHSDYGISYQDAVESDEIIPRVFSADLWGGVIPKNPRNDETYIIKGNARDFSNWEKAY